MKGKTVDELKVLSEWSDSRKPRCCMLILIRSKSQQRQSWCKVMKDLDAGFD